MAQYSEEQLNDCMEVFNLFDNRGDGKIAAAQLGDVLRSLNQNPTEAEIRKCGYSTNPEGRMSFETFMPILQTIGRQRVEPSTEELLEAFKMFDKDLNNTISSAELRHMLTCLGEKLTDEEVDQLISGIEDGQGNINYEEFIKMVKNG